MIPYIPYSDYLAGMHRIGEYIISRANNRMIFMYPTLSAGPDFVVDIAQKFKEEGISYRSLPFLVDRITSQVVLPPRGPLQKAMRGAGKDIFHFIFDDVSASGRTVYIFYDFLRYLGVRDKDITMCSVLDKTGSLDACVVQAYETTISRKKKFIELKRQGKIPKLHGDLYISTISITENEFRRYFENYLEATEMVEIKEPPPPQVPMSVLRSILHNLK